MVKQNFLKKPDANALKVFPKKKKEESNIDKIDKTLTMEVSLSKQRQ